MIRFYENIDNEIDEAILPNVYFSISKAIDDILKESVNVYQLEHSIRMVELVTERIPEAILHLTFLFASIQYKRLRILLSYSIQKFFNGILPAEFVFTIIYGLTFGGIIKAIINKR